MRGIEVKSPVM